MKLSNHVKFSCENISSQMKNVNCICILLIIAHFPVMIISSIEEFQTKINDSKAIMVYFSQDDCSVCKVIKPQLQQMVNEHFPKIEFSEVDCLNNMTLPAQLGIMVVPTILTFFDGKEYFRKYRNLSIPEFKNELTRIYNLALDG